MLCGVTMDNLPPMVAHYTLPSGRPLPLTPNEEPDNFALPRPQLDSDISDNFPIKLVEAGMETEMTSMRDFDVFDEVKEENMTDQQLSEVITSRWVITWKGDILRCRLVARGFEQVLGELDDTYASTPVFTILKILLCIALALGLAMTICDVSTAFLHADLLDFATLYMVPPKEYYPLGGVYWRLKKAMYGLKGAPKAWQDHFAKTLTDIGYTRLRSDANVYVNFVTMVIILVYVDDLMLFGTCEAVNGLLETLVAHFVIKVTGQLNEDGDMVRFLGRLLVRVGDAINFSMPDGYFDEVIEYFKLTKANPARTPMVKVTLSSDSEDPLDATDHHYYRRVVGKLQWVSPIRPDLVYAIKELARSLTAPTLRDWHRAKHVLRYVKGTLHYVLQIRPLTTLAKFGLAMDLDVYVDSDWAGCALTRKSTTGVVMQLLGTAFSTLSRTQETKALSSGEAELYAIGTGMREALHVRNFLIESQIASTVNTSVWTDSTAGKAMATRFGTSKKTRHVQLRYLFCQDLVSEGVITLKKVLGELNCADICTKAVTYDVLARHLSSVGLLTTREQMINFLRIIAHLHGVSNFRQ